MFEEILISTGLAGLFMVRGFIPAFFIALAMRFGPDWGLPSTLVMDLQNAAGSVGFAPSWFTSNPALIILGILALMEVGATKDADLREMLNTVDHYFKPAMAALTYLGVLSATDTAFLESTYMEAGLVSMMVLAGLIVATWIGATMKNMLASSITDMDPDDSLGLQRAMSFVGDAWVIVGAVLVVVLPILVAALVFAMFGVIAILRKRANDRDEASKRVCGSCGELVYACAPICHSCSAQQTDVQDVNWLGAVGDRDAHMESHGYHLVAVGRCPRCASRLGKKAIEVGCPCCGDRPFDSEPFVKGYDGFMRLRLVSTLIVCGLVGLVPILGFAVAIVIYKIQLVGPYRRYIGRGTGMMARWGLRVLLLVAIFLQLVPGPNAFVVAGMALVSFIVYHRLFIKRVRSIHPIAVIAGEAPDVAEG